MRIDPEIAGLRGAEPAPSLLDAALADWRGRRPVAGLLAQLGAYGAGAPLDEDSALARLLRGQRRAAGFAGRALAMLIAAQRAAPLAAVSLGHTTTPGFARIRLAEAGRASLGLIAYACRPPRAPASVLFQDGEVREIVLAGAGRAVVYRRSAAGLVEEEIVCAPGTCLTRSGITETRQIVAVSRPLLVLQLARTAADPALSVELALPGGAPVKSICGSRRESQHMMALAVLGALAHRPALAEMERLACDPSAQRDLRWEALRQVLGLDPRVGMRLLAALVLHRGDLLAGPAARLERALSAAYPALAALESDPCPR